MIGTGSIPSSRRSLPKLNVTRPSFTDIDDVSLDSARDNVVNNDLAQKIEILRSDPDGLVLHPLVTRTSSM
jgi:ribosomal protein L11 methylase PrmA